MTTTTTNYNHNKGKEKNSPLLDRKIDEETAPGLAASFAKQFHFIGANIAATIIRHIAPK